MCGRLSTVKLFYGMRQQAGTQCRTPERGHLRVLSLAVQRLGGESRPLDRGSAGCPSPGRRAAGRLRSALSSGWFPPSRVMHTFSRGHRPAALFSVAPWPPAHVTRLQLCADVTTSSYPRLRENYDVLNICQSNGILFENQMSSSWHLINTK